MARDYDSCMAFTVHAVNQKGLLAAFGGMIVVLKYEVSASTDLTRRDSSQRYSNTQMPGRSV